MTTFNEALHDRDRSGRFTEMPGSAPESQLTAPAETGEHAEARRALAAISDLPKPNPEDGPAGRVSRAYDVVDVAEFVLRERGDARARGIVGQYDRDVENAASTGAEHLARLHFADRAEAYLHDEVSPASGE